MKSHRQIAGQKDGETLFHTLLATARAGVQQVQLQ